MSSNCLENSCSPPSEGSEAPQAAREMFNAWLSGRGPISANPPAWSAQATHLEPLNRSWGDPQWPALHSNPTISLWQMDSTLRT